MNAVVVGLCSRNDVVDQRVYKNSRSRHAQSVDYKPESNQHQSRFCTRAITSAYSRMSTKLSFPLLEGVIWPPDQR
jgi:hypothetical protein